MKRIILSLFVLTTVLVSCKKDKNCDLNSGNFVGNYKITAWTYKADAATPVFDEYAAMAACEKDDIVSFHANGTSTYADAGVVCSPSGNSNGIWSLSGNTVTLDFDTYTVAAFSCSGMTITQSGPAVGELTTITLARQ